MYHYNMQGESIIQKHKATKKCHTSGFAMMPGVGVRPLESAGTGNIVPRHILDN